MLGVQQSRTAAHHTAHPTTISPSTKAKKLGLSSTKQQQHSLQSEAGDQGLESDIAWPGIPRDEPDEEEEEEEQKADILSTNGVNNDSNVNGNPSNALSNQKLTPALSANLDTVERSQPSSRSAQFSHSLDHSGHHNGHLDGVTDPSDFGFSTVPGVDGVFGIGDSLDFVDPSLYLNLDADVVGPSETDHLEETYLNLTNDHIGSSKDDPVPVSSGEQEKEPQPAPSEAKAPSRNLTPLSELSPSPSNFNTDGDRTNGGEENGDQADTSSTSLRVDTSQIDEGAAGDEGSTSGAGAVDATAQPSSALTELSTQQSPPSGSGSDQNTVVDGPRSGPASSVPPSETPSAKTGPSNPPSALPDANGSNVQISSQSASLPSFHSGKDQSGAPQAPNSSHPLSPPKLGQSYLPQQNSRPQNPYPTLLPNALASGSGFQIPNITLPKREGDANQKVMTVLELNAELFKCVFDSLYTFSFPVCPRHRHRAP